jgi:tripartite-type tricarboxylate transporter receptor subunit TctC
MKLPRRQFLQLAAGTATLPAFSRFAWAQTYPTRPVRLIVPFAPGGGFDILARLIGQWLSERLGQPFVIENRPGGAGNIGTEAVVRAPADGYTLLLVGVPNAINATLYDRLNFNFIRDIAPVASLVGGPYVMVVNPSVPAKTVPEFIAYAKANPGKLNMASGGNGSAHHVSGELFKMMAGVNLVHVPYRGAGPALVDLLAGQGKRPHCFPRNARQRRISDEIASRRSDRGSGREAPGRALQGWGLAAPPGLGGASLRLAYRAGPASDILRSAPGP